MTFLDSLARIVAIHPMLAFGAVFLAGVLSSAFPYAIGHCLLMLAAGTFTGFVEAFAKNRGVANLSDWSRKLGGCVVSLTGAWFLWQAF